MSLWMTQSLIIKVNPKPTSSSSSSRDRVITGSARIPLSCLQRGLLFYKYALVNTYSRERECELERISLENSNSPESLKYRNAQLYRVVTIPKTEIKADGKRCYLPQSHDWPRW